MRPDFKFIEISWKFEIKHQNFSLVRSIFFKKKNLLRKKNESLVCRNYLVRVTQVSVWPNGYLSDPYKVIPANQRFIFLPEEVFLFEENRPDEREILVLYFELSRYLDEFKIGTHLSYRFFQDDHALNGHTFHLETNRKFGDKWMISRDHPLVSKFSVSFQMESMSIQCMIILKKTVW